MTRLWLMQMDGSKNLAPITADLIRWPPVGWEARMMSGGGQACSSA
jgi:hypothetical protein